MGYLYRRKVDVMVERMIIKKITHNDVKSILYDVKKD